MKLFILFAALVALLVMAGPAGAKKIIPASDGGTIETGMEERQTNANGQPIGPWHSLPDQAVGPQNGPYARTGVVRSQQSAQGCATVRAWVKRISPAGFFLWQYFHYANFCWKYPNVTGVTRWFDYLTGNGWKYDSTNSSVGQWYTYCCGAFHSGHTRWFRGHFHVNIPLGGLFQSADPQITLKVRGDGSSTNQFAGL